jgi:hypothetical protein
MREAWVEGTEACEGTLEVNREKSDSVAVHEEASKEGAAVETFRVLKKRHGDWHPALGRRGKPKIRTQGKSWSPRKLAAGDRRTTQRERAARRKRHSCNGQDKDKALPRTQKGRTFGTRCRAKPEGIIGIRDRDFKEWLRLGSERTSGRIFGKTTGLEIATRAVVISSGLRKTSDGTLWKGRPPPKRKKRLHTE